MIISHNTFTYRKPKLWYLRPFAWMARCLNKDYIEQLCSGFDIRVFRHNNTWEFKHGYFRYNGDDLFPILNYCNQHGYYVRIMLESRNKSDQKKVKQQDMENMFKVLCKNIEYMYPNITFFGGKNVYTWETLYDFKNQLHVEEYHASVDDCKINDLYPKLYAKKHNKENLDLVKNKQGLFFFDFI